MDLRANTAVDILIGPFVDKTDGNTTEDALTLTQAEIKLSKNGQALAQKNDATSAVFDDDGYYNCELDATDTNTEGQLVVIIHQSANALPVRHEFNVMAEAAWDSLYVAKDTGFMDVNVKEIGDDGQSMTDLKDFADAGYDPATNKVEGVKLADTTTTNTDMRGTDSAALASAYTAARAAFLDNINGHTAQTGDTFAKFAGITLLAEWLGAIAGKQTGDATARTEIRATGAGSGTFDETTDSQEAIRDTAPLGTAMRGTDSASTHTAADVWAAATRVLTANTNLNDPTAAAIADAVLDELLSAHTTPGSLGKALADVETALGTAGAGLTDLGGMSTGMKAEVLVEINAALDTAIAELGVAAPTATPTLRTGLMLLYMALRNKLVVQTSGTDAIEVYNDAGTKIAAKAITDDGSDYTEAEMA